MTSGVNFAPSEFARKQDGSRRRRVFERTAIKKYRGFGTGMGTDWRFIQQKVSDVKITRHISLIQWWYPTMTQLADKFLHYRPRVNKFSSKPLLFVTKWLFFLLESLLIACIIFKSAISIIFSYYLTELAFKVAFTLVKVYSHWRVWVPHRRRNSNSISFRPS